MPHTSISAPFTFHETTPGNVWKYQPGELRILGRMWTVIGTVRGLHGYLAVGRQLVRTEVELRPCGKENISILEDVAENDPPSVGKRRTMRPRVAVVFRQCDRSFGITKRPVVALRVDVHAGGLQAVPEVIRFKDVGRRIVRLGAPRDLSEQEQATDACQGVAQKLAANHYIVLMSSFRSLGGIALVRSDSRDFVAGYPAARK